MTCQYVRCVMSQILAAMAQREAIEGVPIYRASCSVSYAAGQRWSAQLVSEIPYCSIVIDIGSGTSLHSKRYLSIAAPSVNTSSYCMNLDFQDCEHMFSSPANRKLATRSIHFHLQPCGAMPGTRDIECDAM